MKEKALFFARFLNAILKKLFNIVLDYEC